MLLRFIALVVVVVVVVVLCGMGIGLTAVTFPFVLARRHFLFVTELRVDRRSLGDDGGESTVMVMVMAIVRVSSGSVSSDTMLLEWVPFDCEMFMVANSCFACCFCGRSMVCCSFVVRLLLVCCWFVIAWVGLFVIAWIMINQMQQV